MGKNWSVRGASRHTWNTMLALTIAVCLHGAQAATFTVGPDGTYGSIQAGMAAALIVGGTNEVHVEAGSYAENLTLTMSTGTITVIGGWNSTFTQHSLDPTSTQVSGSGTARVFTVTIDGGKFAFTGLTLLGGSDTTTGGGLSANVQNAGSLELRNSIFTLNTVTGAPGTNVFGGAIYARLYDTAVLIIDDVEVASNSATQTADAWNTDGGGIFLDLLNSSDASISNSSIHGNFATATGTASARSGGLGVVISDSARFSLSRSRVVGNTVSAAAANHANFSGTFASAECAGACEMDFTLDTYDENVGPSAQLDVSVSGGGTPKAYLADLLVSRGDANGLMVSTDSGAANAVNLTLANNALEGLYLSPFDASSTITLYNSVMFGNGGDYSFSGAPVLGNNLVGVDPHFVDAANGNFHIKADSPARDAGTSSPPGGLGLFDLDGNPRTFGPKPDIGAYEVGDEIFKNGFN